MRIGVTRTLYVEKREMFRLSSSADREKWSYLKDVITIGVKEGSVVAALLSIARSIGFRCIADGVVDWCVNMKLIAPHTPKKGL